MTELRLTAAELTAFQRRQRRFLTGLGVLLAYVFGVGAAGEFFSLEPYGLAVTLGGIVVGIGALITMFGYRCPACNKIPRARSWSFGGGEVAYTTFVALFPKTCSECGVHFKSMCHPER